MWAGPQERDCDDRRGQPPHPHPEVVYRGTALFAPGLRQGNGFEGPFFWCGHPPLCRPLFGRSCVLRAVWEIPRRPEPAEREGGRPDNLTPRRPGAEAIARPPPRDDAPAVGGRRRARRTGFVTTPRQTLWQRVKQPQEVPRLLRPRCPGGPRSRRRGLRCRMPPSCLPLHPYLSHY